MPREVESKKKSTYSTHLLNIDLRSQTKQNPMRTRKTEIRQDHSHLEYDAMKPQSRREATMRCQPDMVPSAWPLIARALIKN